MAVRPTRAESFTANKKQTEYFSDFLNSFAKTPVGDKLARVTNEQSVNQSLRNIIKTINGERLFNPDFGSQVLSSLFEPNDFFQLEQIKSSITHSINRFERRVNLISVDVKSALNSRMSFDGMPENNESTIEIVIVYSLINSIDPITTSFLLKRVR